MYLYTYIFICIRAAVGACFLTPRSSCKTIWGEDASDIRTEIKNLVNPMP